MARNDGIDPAAITALLQRIFPGSSNHFARAESGGSTPVYRVWHGDEIFYLRLSEEPEASLLPEVQIHTMLRRQGVKVPEVVYFEPFDASIQRSAMLTTEIRGEHISQTSIGTEMSTILREAGRDLAIINDIPVEGFGWIRRDQHDETKLEAEHPSFQDFIFEHLDADLALLGAQVLTADETAATRTLIEQASALFPPGQAWLAHGDLDVTHIFQEHGRYTGIIDFGEIRGAGRVYDLGHFNLHDGERLNQRILHFLLEGYQEITALPPDYEWQIQVTSLMIGIRALARAMLRPPSNYRHSLTTAIRSLIKGLDSVELFRPGL